MTTYGDQLYQFGGVPVGWDYRVLPFTKNEYRGKSFWVDGLDGNDESDGDSPEDAVATIEAAITKANARISWSRTPWATGDTIYVMPGVYAENLTALPYGCNLIGLGDAFDINGQRGVTIKPASGYPFDGTSVINSRIENICFESPDASGCFEVENFNRNLINHCVFTGLPGGSPTTAYGLRIKDETNADGNGDMTGSRISNCLFQVLLNGIHIEVDNGSSKQASGNIIENCIIRGTTTKGIYFHVDSVPSYTIINNCIVGDGSTTLALGLDDDTDQIGVFNTCFEATANDPASGAGKYNNCYLNGALIT